MSDAKVSALTEVFERNRDVHGREAVGGLQHRDECRRHSHHTDHPRDQQRRPPDPDASLMQGGDHVPANLQTACAARNGQKARRVYEGPTISFASSAEGVRRVEISEAGVPTTAERLAARESDAPREGFLR